MTSPFRDDIHPRLPYTGLLGRKGKHEYHASKELVDAANVALALELPLLLTGEPGSGKTEFADVMANYLGGLAGQSTPIEGLGPTDPLECHVRSDSTARDLLYHYDAMLRFTDGHHGGKEGEAKARDARNYIDLDALGIALTRRERRVVLIDEIDKAPRDLPNDLLRELDRGEFEIPEIPPTAPGTIPDRRTGVGLARIMRRPVDEHDRALPMPFILITSNVERQLPDPFLRRCVFFHIRFPAANQLEDILRSRFASHPGPSLVSRLILEKDFVKHTVQIFEMARKVPSLVKKPSTAELLAWVEALGCFAFDNVRDAITNFAGTLTGDGVARGSLRYTDLPAAGCLFKLHEDWDAAARHHAAAPGRP